MHFTSVEVAKWLFAAIGIVAAAPIITMMMIWAMMYYGKSESARQEALAAMAPKDRFWHRAAVNGAITGVWMMVLALAAFIISI